jgi:hypothetical protein
MTAFRRFPLLLPVIGVVACGDPGAPPPVSPIIRTILVHREDTGENRLLNTDGSDAGTYRTAGEGLLPVGVSVEGQVVAFLQGRNLVLGSLVQPAELDTILVPAPASMSLVSFSRNEQFVAVVSYVPDRAVILYDRVNHRADTLPYGTVEPVLPPMLSPDNARIALIGLTDLSLVLTTLFPADQNRLETATLGSSRSRTRPNCGWPRWTSDGIVMAFIRVAATGPDTILLARIDPANPGERLDERYRAVMAPVSDERPELVMGVLSTYALTTDGRVLVLAAQPSTDPTRHAVYLVTPDVGRVQLLLDDPAQFPVFPQFVRE